MIGLTFSKRVSDFVDAADVGGNIKNSKANLNYLRLIDIACVKSGITIGAVYPFIGGTAFSHQFNLLDPRDLDSAFRLAFFGGLTHSALGVKPNGTTGYAETYISSSNLILNNTHLSYYSNENITGGTRILLGLGTQPYVAGTTFLLLRTNFNNNFNSIIGTENANAAFSSSTYTRQGMFLGNRNAINSNKLYHNANIIAQSNSNNTYSYPVSNTIYLFAGGNTANKTAGSFEINRCAFASVGNGMSDYNAKIFSHDIFIAQRSIGRA